METQPDQPKYHHGDLRRSALDRVRERILAEGVASVSIRGIAAEVGVTHTAINHVFGSRSGLLTAFAVEGFEELASRLEEAAPNGLRSLGLAYVRFGLEWPAHFTVMFDPGLFDSAEALRTASDRTWSKLRAGIEGVEQTGADDDPAVAALAAWSLVHGIVTLHNSGALERANIAGDSETEGHLGADAILDLADRAAGLLFRDQL